MTPDRFAQASFVSIPDYLAKTGLTIDSFSGPCNASSGRKKSKKSAEKNYLGE
jgi:hypothetical protein